MSYPNYPNYPSYPASAGGYPAVQPQQPYPGYPPQPGIYPGYPTDQTSAYPASQPGYPSYPPANNQYPPAGGLPYPVQPQQPYYPAPAPAYPQYSASAPQQVGHPPVGLQPAPGGIYPSIAPFAPSAVGYQPQQQRMEPNIPTVHPASPFDARADADALHKAMKGLGTDEKALITILCHRTSSQRAEINRAYKSGYGKDLESKLKSELSGAFEKVMIALCLPLADYMAREMYIAISGLGTNEGTLVEILCSGTNQEIRDINAAYVRLYGHPMEKDIKGDTSGTFKMLLVSLAQGLRDENQVVDVAQAKADAQRLFQAGAAKLGTDESAFNSILATRSWAHLRQVMTEYQAMHGHSLEKAVISEFSANAEKGLLGILQCAANRPGYFAQRLHNAIVGMGTKDQNLIRIIVSRCDVDLGNIKREYEKLFKRSLHADVSGDTSGDYKKALLALLG
ncbi:annexin B9-like [Daphnia carinata]|uniref:annexin B9-like n=1 Tax=Daphnia carinata TaxID=120202 RepID=UPI00257F5BE0|nr:annexin B9-like [Daphnia carinata]XP_057380446.1 annexin B9-like [Daphnia carinata]